MRKSLTLLTFILPLLACTQSEKQSEPRTERPNVVLIISDDHGWTDYGFLGHAVVKTPALDRLASESAVFTRGYLTTALCRPSLATLITGLYAHQHKIPGNDMAPSPDHKKTRKWRFQPAYQERAEALIANIEQVETLPRILAERGYVSYQSGKWWEGHYSRGGFSAGMTHGDPARGGRHGDEGLKIGREGMAPVLDFIDSAGDQPFFVWYAPFLPHSPHNPPERLLEKYSSPDRPEELAKYYAMVEWLDETCAELLGHLEKRGIADNTLVVYLADNGYVKRTPETPLPEVWKQSYAPRSKLSVYEMGTRTPVMIRWPERLKPSLDETTLVSSIDIVPTILAACGLEKSESMEGLDLLPFCEGQASSREAVFGELFAHDVVDHEDPAKSLLYRWCIEGKWKLIVEDGGKVGRYWPTLQPLGAYPQLYDLELDPFEKRAR